MHFLKVCIFLKVESGYPIKTGKAYSMFNHFYTLTTRFALLDVHPETKLFLEGIVFVFRVQCEYTARCPKVTYGGW